MPLVPIATFLTGSLLSLLLPVALLISLVVWYWWVSARVPPADRSDTGMAPTATNSAPSAVNPGPATANPGPGTANAGPGTANAGPATANPAPRAPSETGPPAHGV